MKPTLGRVRADQHGGAPLGDADWLRSWVPTQQTRCKGYDAGCSCRKCQKRDSRLPEEPLPEDFRQEVRNIVRGTETPRFALCSGYDAGCTCPNCKPREERAEQRRKLRQMEREGLIEREPDDPSEEFARMMRGNRGIF